MVDVARPSFGGPGGRKQHAWDATSLDTFMLCPRRYQLAILEGWEPQQARPALEFGRALHTVREAFLRAQAAGLAREDALRVAVRVALAEGRVLNEVAALAGRQEARRRNGLNLLRSIVWWVDEFGPDDPVTTLMLPDGRPAIELSWALPTPAHTREGEQVMLCGHMDRIVRFAGGVYVQEWKHTTTTLGPYYWVRYSPNVQVSLYVVAARAFLDEPVTGMLIDATQVGVQFVRAARRFVQRTRGQGEEFLHHALHWIARAEDCADRGEWPMNEAACHAHGGCPFRGICSLDPQVRERFLAANFQRREELWEPLRVREAT